MTSRTLADWLALLEQRHPRAIDLGLERIAEVARRAGIGRPADRVVTVAGTNGKGSCVGVLAALLRAAGHRVGVYTSPHLVRYNERILLPQGEADDTDICAAFERIEQARGDISLTYFEFGTLAAFDLMARARCEVVVLEVGLGGRLDAVNLVDADVAVITSIGLDHQDWLGDNRDSIGLEKAGIARPGRPVVVTDPSPPEAMIQALSTLGSRVLQMGVDFGPSAAAGSALPPASAAVESRFLGPEGEPVSLVLTGLPSLPLPSVLGAVQAALLLDDAGVLYPILQAALPEVSVPGRWQRLRWRDRELVLDVAHNPDAARLLAQRLTQAPARRYRGVCAIMADKDVAAILQPLASVLESLEVADLPDVARAATAADLAAAAATAGIPVRAHPSPQQALAAAVEQADADDCVVVFGSFLVVGPLLQYIQLSGAGHDRQAARHGETP